MIAITVLLWHHIPKLVCSALSPDEHTLLLKVSLLQPEKGDNPDTQTVRDSQKTSFMGMRYVTPVQAEGLGQAWMQSEDGVAQVLSSGWLLPKTTSKKPLDNLAQTIFWASLLQEHSCYGEIQWINRGISLHKRSRSNCIFVIFLPHF